MKLVLQIALGVFLGASVSQLTVDAWHAHQTRIAKEEENVLRAEQEKAREAQAERIRALFMRNSQGKGATKGGAPLGFVPDDAQEPAIK